MDVQLYVYDLSHGLARQMSPMILGRQVDAIYHTSLVFEGVEYLFGLGIQTCLPGTSPHGQPMDIITLGKTELPLEIIIEYLETSLRPIYTAQSYDLFKHNCNDFTNDFATFLVGKGIPEYIISLPKEVLDTPFGRMIQPQLDAAARQVTQAPIDPLNHASIPNSSQNQNNRNGVPDTPRNDSLKTADQAQNGTGSRGKVWNVKSQGEIEQLLASASKTCAVMFFTSSTCAPCKLVYQPYDDLAADAPPGAIFIKVDINAAHDVASMWKVRATPSFITLLKGDRFQEWTGADPRELRQNVQLLLQAAFSHAHSKLNLPILDRQRMRPVTFSKVPPLEKVISKLEDHGQDPAIKDLQRFITEMESKTVKKPSLPDFARLNEFLVNAPVSIPVQARFAVYDLLRVALNDIRVSDHYADNFSTIETLIEHVLILGSDCPYNLRLVCLHMVCNTFASSLLSKSSFTKGKAPESCIQLVTSSLLDDKHNNVRVAAGSLAYNLALANYSIRRSSNSESLAESMQVELAASVIETLGVEEESRESVLALVLCLVYLVHYAPEGGELMDLCKAMDARSVVQAKVKLSGDSSLVKEVTDVLLLRGL